MASTEVTTKGQGPTEREIALYRQLETMLEGVPGADDEAVVSMAEAILAAASPDELDAPWNGVALQDFIDRLVSVQSIKWMPSDYPDGPPFYLVCSGVAKDTGEVATFISGSVLTMVQLIKAHHCGWLPLDVIPRIAERPSDNGYYPQHLEVYRLPKSVGRIDTRKVTEKVQQRAAAPAATGTDEAGF